MPELAFEASADRAGELTSLSVRGPDGRPLELLQKLEPPLDGFAGGASWLFPAVGRSRVDGVAGFWRHAGRMRPMPLHGFAMRLPWETAAGAPGRAAFRAVSDESTREAYPFDFSLSAEYFLERGAVVARARAQASRRNAEPMPFSWGNHLTLSLAALGDCAIVTPAREVHGLTREGFLTGETSASPYSRPTRLADDPALADMVLGGYEEGQAWCEVRSAHLRLRVTQRALTPGARPEHFRFVFYSDRRAFFCPEPWYGAPDSLNTGKGVLRLDPGEEFAWEMRLEASEA